MSMNMQLLNDQKLKTKFKCNKCVSGLCQNFHQNLVFINYLRVFIKPIFVNLKWKFQKEEAED